MLTNNKFYQKTTQHLTLFTLLGLLFTYGCQKEKLYEITTETATTATHALSIEKATIQMVYGIQAAEISKAELQTLYTELVSSLSTEQKSQLDEAVQEYLTPTPVNSVNNDVTFRNHITTLPAGNRGDNFGTSIAKTGNTLFVGAPGKSRVYVYNNPAPVQILWSSTGGEGFGRAVVASGDWLAVEALRQVFLFKKEGDTWVEKHVITPDLEFVAMSATGTDMAIDGNNFAIAGRKGNQSVILMYELNDGTWVEDGIIDLIGENIFLWDIDISGGTLVGNGGAGNGILFNPQVYIMQKTGGTWGITSQVAFPAGYILARAVAIDKSTIVANTAFGTLGANHNILITDDANNWSVTGALVQPAPLPFSQTRHINIDGSKVVIAVPTGGFAPTSGDVVHVFDAGVLVETLSPSEGGLDYMYGSDLYIQGDEIGVGAPAESDEIFGNVFIYNQ